MNNDIRSYLQDKREESLEELKQFLRIPSVSVGAERQSSIRVAADWLAAALKKAGLEHVDVMETAGNPVVYADWLHAPGKPTVLVYGHYDVQPADPAEGWESDPFEPVVKDGKLYARGATDDKGQLLIHLKAVQAMLAVGGGLPVNMKFCLEGEEEIASRSLFAFLERERERLQADVVVISDGPMYGRGQPSMLYGLRGLCGFELRVNGPSADLHSGLYGGGVQNPIHALVELLVSMRDADGRITVEGFYNGVRPIGSLEEQRIAQLGHDEAKVRAELGVRELFGEQGYSFLARTTARPTLEVNSITGGFQGEGLKPSVPASAVAKLSCRLVDEQTPDAVMASIERHIAAHTPPGVTVEVKRLVQGMPFSIDPDNPYMKTAARALRTVYGIEPVYVRGGGSIPIVDTFSRLLQAPVINLNFGLPDERLHAPNEHFHLENFDKGLLASIEYYRLLGEESKAAK